MASRPFNTSAKEPMSVKLRGLNPSKSVTRQLEIDSRRMEERLRELKVAMNREKQERERQGSAGSGGIWSSAQQGNDVMKKKSPAKPTKPGENKVRKIKVLKDTPIEVPKRAPKKNPTTLNSVRKSFSGPPCGQCEDKPVALTCMECGENYCAGCFAKFHLKGALRQHRSIPFHSGSNENSPNNSMEAKSDSQPEARMNSKPSIPKTSSGADSHSNQQGRVIIAKTTPPKDPSPKTGNSIFDGDYNEEESAASFAAALAEWRQAKKGGQQNGVGGQEAKKDVHDMGSGTTAGLDDDKKPVEISFQDNPSLSYADRLLLKKHRRTDLPAALSPTPSQLANHYLPREANSRMGDGDLTNGHYDRSEEELEMEEEHQRYANIFVKESPREEMERPRSNLTIMEISDEDATVEKDLEVQSVYSVQEWDSVINAPSPHVMVMTPDNNNTEIKPTDTSMKAQDVQSRKSASKVTDSKVMPSGKGSSAKVDQRVSKGSAKSARKDLEKQTPSASLSKSRSGTASRAGEGREKQSAQVRPSSKTSSARSAVTASSSQQNSASQKSSRGEKSLQGRQSATGRQPSAGGGKNKPQEDVQGRQSAMEKERPPSTGISTLPSKELQEIARMRPGWQHQQGYQEGLGSFFMGGVDVKDKEDTNRKEMETVRTHTPTNVLPECSYKGPSTWRPDSSMSNHPDQPATILSPSPPKQAKDTKSSSMSGRKRSSVPMATGTASSGTPIKGNTTISASSNQSATTSATPRAMSSKPRSGVAGRTPRTSAGVAPGKAGASNVDNTLHWRLSQADKMKGAGIAPNGPRKMATGDHSASSSASTIPPRSSSRIEVDGDDMTGYDDDGEVRRREEEDHEALEQLTWELASNEGRITADGRISSLSLIEGFDENLLLMAEEEQDRALGITQDDGLGSGLSTPCNDLSLDQLSEEELRSDFEVAADNQRYKDEVQALNS